MTERDLFVVNIARQQNIALAMVLAGGYGQESAIGHSTSIQHILKKFDGVT